METTAEALRFQTALVMAETGVRLMRQNLRRRYSEAPDAEVDRDNVEASYRDGMLLITLPRRFGPTPQTVQIPVTG